MLKKILDFFKNIYNLLMLIFTILAFIFCAMSGLWYYFSPLAILLFGGDCIVLAIKIFIERNKNEKKQISEFFSEVSTKSSEREYKNETRSKIFYSVIFFILGLIFVYSAIMGFCLA